MFSVLSNTSFRNLFLAQNFSLLGTGLATVALSLLAFDLTGKNAALLLSSLFTIKMVIYVFFSPIAGAFANKFNRRLYLVFLDIVRAIAAIGLFFVSEIWHVYFIISVIYISSAAFTPIYQSTIPQLFNEDEDYTKALSLSRMAIDLENILGYSLAALILVFYNYKSLFIGTSIGFIASALLILSIFLPIITESDKTKDTRFIQKITYGVRKFTLLPELKGLMFMNLAVSAGGAMILVNSVILIRLVLGMDEEALPVAMFFFGFGSVLGATQVPRILKKYSLWNLMHFGAYLISIVFILFSIIIELNVFNFILLLIFWFISGFGYSLVLTPMGRIIRASAKEDELSQLFAAQFSLSHLCWLFMYPLAGYLITMFDVTVTLYSLAIIIILATIVSSSYTKNKIAD
ncbi:MAG: MFS transporter [Hyphomicrobiales bacterium]